MHNAVHNAGNPYAVGYFATKVRRCKLKVSNSVLQAPVVSALEQGPRPEPGASSYTLTRISLSFSA